jgi:hypothetical protein
MICGVRICCFIGGLGGDVCLVVGDRVNGVMNGVSGGLVMGRGKEKQRGVGSVFSALLQDEFKAIVFVEFCCLRDFCSGTSFCYDLDILRRISYRQCLAFYSMTLVSCASFFFSQISFTAVKPVLQLRVRPHSVVAFSPQPFLEAGWHSRRWVCYDSVQS